VVDCGRSVVDVGSGVVPENEDSGKFIGVDQILGLQCVNYLSADLSCELSLD